MSILRDKKKALFIDFKLIATIENQSVIYKERVFTSLSSIAAKTDFDLVLCSCKKEEKEIVLDSFKREGIFFESENCDYDLSLSYKIESLRGAIDINCVSIEFKSWPDVDKYLTNDSELNQRKAESERITNETDISISINLDGTGSGIISTGIGFYDHMLDQVKKHSKFDIDLSSNGDLDVDEHHTIEDVALVFGDCVKNALGDKKGIERYGYEIVVMDEVSAVVALDFSSRPELVWNVEFTREYVGDFPTELFRHFFRSFSTTCGASLYISIENPGDNHHMAEAIFKAFGRALRRAVKRIPGDVSLPSTKGCL